MTSAQKHRIDPGIRAMLDAAGVDWCLKQGSSHLKLYIEGHMVSVLPTRRHRERFNRNTYAVRSAVRRALNGQHHK